MATEELCFRVKQVMFAGKKRAVCMQNENGPCPLLALANVLLLRGLIAIHEDYAIVTSTQVVEMLAAHITRHNPPHKDESLRANQEHQINTAMETLPLLNYGMDVNVRFGSVGAFEYTAPMDVFAMAGVALYHGWVVDPQHEAAGDVADVSYNRLVELVIAKNDEEAKPAEEQDAEVIRRGLACKHFLDESASQLTYQGLASLHQTCQTGELSVFFRNNHFSTLYKHRDGHLYLLATDEGYTRRRIVWECMHRIDGDNEFVDAEFRALEPTPSSVPSTTAAATTPVAAPPAPEPTHTLPAHFLGGGVEDDARRKAQEARDAELAYQLQREEELRAQSAAAARGGGRGRRRGGPRRGRRGDGGRRQARAHAVPSDDAHYAPSHREERESAGKSCVVM